MPRVTLTELVLTLSADPRAPEAYRARWILQETPAYPEPPGVMFDVRVLGKAETRFSWTPADRVALAGAAPDLVGFGARLLVPESAALVARAAAARGPDRWSRATVAVTAAAPGDALHELPWEALFAAHGLVVLRRERSLDSYRGGPRDRARLAFPLKLWAVGHHGNLFPGDVLDAYGARAIELGALAWYHYPKVAPDILHGVGRPFATMFAPHLTPRVVVWHEPDASAASAAVTSGLLGEFGAEAALHLTGADRRDAVRTLYRKLLHDWPLDRILGELRELHGVPAEAAILHCRPRGELSVTLSSVIESALTPDRSSKGLESIERGAAVRGYHAPSADRSSERLRDAWRAALQAPHDALVRRARELTIHHEESDLHQAVALAGELAAVVPEQAEIEQVIAALDDARASDVVAGSARVTQVRITDAATGDDVASDTSLVIERPYRLHVQIVREARAAAWASQLFPEGALRETLARLGAVDLVVVIYPLGDGVRLSSPGGTIRLRALGDSDPLGVDLTLSRPGGFALRVCVYHDTALLQAVLVEGIADEHEGRPGGVQAALDFAASADFLALDQHARPDVTIWTNEVSDGTHWFGVFARDGEHRVRLTRTQLAWLPPEELGIIAKQLQAALEAVLLRPGKPTPVMQRPERAYRFDPATPEDDRQRGERLDQLVALAVAGWDAYSGLFGVPSEDSPAASADEALLSIARCRPDRTNLAWAALYDYYLDGSPPAICDVFARQLRAGQDLLDEPGRCRAQPACPLGDAQRRDRTVCPFGFWGLRHRIEQPPNHIAPPAEPALDGSEPLPAASRLATAIRRPAGDAPRLGVAWWPHFDERVRTHLETLVALGPAEVESERTRILALLERGQKQIYYFFCHGAGENLSFVLQVGPGKVGDTIKVGDLNHRKYTWSSDGPAPLVFLNGCNTTAFRGDTINKLIDRLRAMGASGVVGTEIPVHTHLAEDVGKRVIDELAAGRPLGPAFLAMRRWLLRAQVNPLGLAYAFFGADQLHLCDGEACRTCRRPEP